MGAILQCFALQEALKDLQPGAVIRVLDFKYRERRCRPSYLDVFKYKAHGRLAALKGLAHIYYAFRQRMKSAKSCTQEFIDSNLDLEEVELTDDKRLDISGRDFDILVAGSDQIWSDWSIQPYFLLECSPHVDCKIAYAPSLGNLASLSDRSVRMLSTALPQFDCLSCREEDGCNFISKLTSAFCPCVPDPTFLLTHDRWEKAVNRPVNPPKGRFVFCYQISFDKLSSDIASTIARKYGLELVVKRYIEPYAFYADIGPSEFLWYISNASFVVTPSFHGTLFSVLFGTPFLSVRSSAPQSRIMTMLGILGLGDRFVGDLKQALDLAKAKFGVDKEIIYEQREKGRLFLNTGFSLCNSRLKEEKAMV